MQHQTTTGHPLKGPLAMAVGAVALLALAAFYIFGNPSLIDGTVKTTRHDAVISQELLWEKAADPLTQEIKNLYRNQHMTPLLDSGSAKTKDGAQRLLAANRAIDSLKIQSLAVVHRKANDTSSEPEILVTATYSMDPPLDNITTRTFRAKAKNRGAGSWTFYGETTP